MIVKYKSVSDHIPADIDDEPLFGPNSEITIVLIGTSRTMTFTDNLDSNPQRRVLEIKVFS